jgi:hypothetical protein
MRKIYYIFKIKYRYGNDTDVVMFKWLTLLLNPREISGSNLSSETRYPEIFRGLPQFLKVNARIVS